MPLTRTLTIAAVVLALLAPAEARAFDYLEHLYFTDRACREVQRELAPVVRDGDASDATTARYLALAIMCPARWETPYCRDGYKQAVGSLNRIEEPAVDSGDYAITLGDYAALPDHVSRFGPIEGLPRAGNDGLTAHTLEWLVRDGTARGAIEDVAEDACETRTTPWEVVESDVTAMVSRYRSGDVPEIRADYLSALDRAAVPRGAHDPPMKYSFDNPHYLDLVLRNHSHFGAEAYAAWLGFHGVAIEIARSSCARIVAADHRFAENLGDRVDGFEDVDFRGTREETARQMCAMLSGQIRSRLVGWAGRADPELVEPVREVIASLETRGDAVAEAQNAALLDRVVAAVLSLVFEGSGIHFVQDGLAGGHMRTIRSREALVEVRHDHDRDNRDGVVALMITRAGVRPFVAYGDGYLLGPTLGEDRGCNWIDGKRFPPEKVSDCVIQHQRGLMVATTAASLLDWVRGGTMDQVAETCPPEGLAAFVCRTLPLAAPFAAGTSPPAETPPETFYHGTLPVPPPRFSYESLAVGFGLEVTRAVPEIGVRLSFLSELDRPAHWLTSYDMALNVAMGRGSNTRSMIAEFAYAFHYRFYARVLLDLVPYVFAGLRGLDSEVDFVAGAGPAFGLTVLPEGWVKIPLALRLSYRFPVILMKDARLLPRRPLTGHWVGLSVGLAFMH